MKIRPLHDRVIVKRLEEEKTSPGGIVIPDSAAEKPVRGEIVAAGNGKVLGGGMPVGAIAGRADVMEVFTGLAGGRGIFSGGTFSGNPMTMAAGAPVGWSLSTSQSCSSPSSTSGALRTNMAAFSTCLAVAASEWLLSRRL